MKFKFDDLTDSGLRKWVSELDRPGEVTGLDLSWADITDISPLEALTELRSLDLLNNLDLTDITPLARLPKLADLNLSGTLVKNIKPLSALAELRSLILDCEKLRDITPIEGLPLEYLDVSCPYKSLAPLKKLPRLRRLRSLEVGNCLKDLEIIGSLTQLEDLCLLQLGTKTLSPLAGLVNLRRLDLSSLMFTELAPLARLPRLEELILDWTHFLELSPLKSFPYLKKLSLQYACIRNFETLAELTGLLELDLRKLQNFGEKDKVFLIEKLPGCNIVFE